MHIDSIRSSGVVMNTTFAYSDRGLYSSGKKSLHLPAPSHSIYRVTTLQGWPLTLKPNQPTI
jgi:hypothetical protein